VTGPAVWVLRVPAVIAGVLTVWLAYVSLRGIWGRTVALSTALILAGLPINIGYSRFGWDPSLLGPFIVLAIALAGRGMGVAATLTLAAAVLVHPTAVFALPIVWALVLGAGRAPADGRWWHSTLLRSIGLAAGSLVVVWLTRLLSGERQSVGLPAVVERVTDVDQAWEFTTYFFSLFSGRSVYNYFVSFEEPATRWLILERWALAATLVIMTVGAFGAIRQRSWRDVGLLGGTLTSLALLYLTSGTAAVKPDDGRYSVYVVPAVVLCFVLALKHCGLLGFASWQRRQDRSARHASDTPGAPTPDPSDPFEPGRRIAIGGALALTLVLLTITAVGYLQPLRTDGSNTHEAFLTARVDPRQQAWQIVSAQSGVAQANIYCESWWICYPLQYFAGSDADAPTITTVNGDAAQLVTARAADFVVARSGSALDQFMTQRFQAEQLSGGVITLKRWFVADLQGRPTYTVFRF
jgi:hypothetical protein